MHTPLRERRAVRSDAWWRGCPAAVTVRPTPAQLILLGRVPHQHCREETKQALGLRYPIHLGVPPHAVLRPVVLGIGGDQIGQALRQQLVDHDSQHFSAASNK